MIIQPIRTSILVELSLFEIYPYTSPGILLNYWASDLSRSTKFGLSFLSGKAEISALKVDFNDFHPKSYNLSLSISMRVEMIKFSNGLNISKITYPDYQFVFEI
jgi:hypothetical protein